MNHSFSCKSTLIISLIYMLAGATHVVAQTNEPSATGNGNGRIVFVGDSITGQGGGWLGAGYVFKMREALRAVYPEGQHDLVPLGGSGMGVGAWLGLAKDEARQKCDLDVNGVEVAAALSQPADRLVVMLGMNDVLAPYVSDTEAGLDQWIANYRELVGLLSARQNFEAGYAARWIDSATARRLKLDLKTSGVGTAIHLTVWLNGQRLYADLIASEPNRQTSREVDLRAGWNVLICKTCHRTWQWQQAVTLTELDGSTPRGLLYRASAPLE